MPELKPFWRYYGGKWRAAPHYPKPEFNTIVEPFAGAAGYSLRYPDCDCVLIDKYPVIVGIWRYLIRVRSEEIMRIPFVEDVSDLPSWVPEEARWLVGFSMNSATVSPCRVLSAGRRKMRSAGRKYEGWSDALKERIASQVNYIRHWEVYEADYKDIDADGLATWFVDPPYNNKAGSRYKHSAIDFAHLGDWCRQLKGQVMVCENSGADWLPFRPFRDFQVNRMTGRVSSEVIWP